jgi:hypothetical protein
MVDTLDFRHQLLNPIPDKRVFPRKSSRFRVANFSSGRGVFEESMRRRNSIQSGSHFEFHSCSHFPQFFVSARET